MNLNFLRIISRKFRVRSLVLAILLAIYVAITFVIFFQLVVPSFKDGTTSDVFCVDSTVYVYMADSLREGRNDPWVLASLSHFPNTLWVPVAISLALNSAFLIMLANYSIAVISVALLKKTVPISTGVFVSLLLLNPTTTTSILCVNKEIVDFFCISLFLYAEQKGRYFLLPIALFLSVLNRWELSVVMILYMIARGPLNPFRKQRFLALFMIVAMISFATPHWAGKMLTQLYEEAQSARTVAFLDGMQMHYLYMLVVVPKIAQNLFGFIFDPAEWSGFSSWGYIMIFDNIAFAVVVSIAAKRRLLSLQSDFVYLGAIGAVIVAQTLVPQPRYFYFVYVLLCLRVAQTRTDCDVRRELVPVGADKLTRWASQEGGSLG